MPTVLIRSGRHPLVVCLAGGLLVTSLYGILGISTSASIDKGLDYWQRVAWAVQGIFGSGTLLAGLHWMQLTKNYSETNAIRALLIERAGQLGVAFGSVTFVIVLCSVSSFADSGLVTTLATSICLGSLWRAWQITKGMRRIRQHYARTEAAR